ncbi:MAG: TIGR01777 family oxidoreductase [Sphingobacteriales bacterium]|jgi:uncharacterized protein (TIGR01777 family)
MATVLITGGTGMIGTALSKILADNGFNVIIVSRNPLETAAKHDYKARELYFRDTGKVYYSRWDIDKQYIDPAALAEADYIVHLAGAGVAEKRWTESRKREILESRVRSSEFIVKALKENPNKVRAVVSSSAIGWYGADNGKPFVETDPHSHDFLGETCSAWEKSISGVTELGKRLVILRTGIVMSNEGGALAEFRKPMRTGVATILGSGNQVISWIHVEDLCRLYMHAIDEKEMSGVYNAVAPNPATNRELTNILAQHVTNGRAITMKVPEFALKLALGEMSMEVLKSATVSSAKVQSTGFQFIYPRLERAIESLY